jgi:hypothetical protein
VHDLKDRVEDAFHVFPDSLIEIVQVAATNPIPRLNIGTDSAQDRIVLEDRGSS